VTYDRLGRSHETKESSDHSNKSKEGSSESSSYIWHLLASLNNIESTEIYMSALGAKQWKRKLTDELVDLETDLVDESGRLLIVLRIGGSLGFLLNWLLDVISLCSEFLGLRSVMSDKDVVDYRSAGALDARDA
jgi:hypothetical protein